MNAWGINYFIDLFKNQVEKYILKIIGNIRPKHIIVCMIYYPDIHKTGGWADRVLSYLGYDANPAKLQMIIHQIFIHATSKIRIDNIVPFPMYSVLDGKNSDDYVQRVEPSSKGGHKLAQAFAEKIHSLDHKNLSKRRG